VAASNQQEKRKWHMSQGEFVSNFELKNLAAVFFTHLANSHTAFGQLFWFSGKCVFV